MNQQSPIYGYQSSGWRRSVINLNLANKVCVNKTSVVLISLTQIPNQIHPLGS